MVFNFKKPSRKGKFLWFLSLKNISIKNKRYGLDTIIADGSPVNV